MHRICVVRPPALRVCTVPRGYSSSALRCYPRQPAKSRTNDVDEWRDIGLQDRDSAAAAPIRSNLTPEQRWADLCAIFDNRTRGYSEPQYPFPYSSRTVAVENRGKPDSETKNAFAAAYASLFRIINRNGVVQQYTRERRFEKPKYKRQRKRMESHRVRFSALVSEKVRLIVRLRGMRPAKRRRKGLFF